MEKGARMAISQAKDKLYDYRLCREKKSILVGVGFSGRCAWLWRCLGMMVDDVEARYFFYRKHA